MKNYIQTKFVTAIPITRKKYVREYGGGYGGMDHDGYKVSYPDGFTFWESKEEFDKYSREITVGEINFLT